MWFEPFESMTLAIQREKQMKEWRRAWKIQLIEADNPRWDDLFLRMTAAPEGPLSHLNEPIPAVPPRLARTQGTSSSRRL